MKWINVSKISVASYNKLVDNNIGVNFRIVSQIETKEYKIKNLRALEDWQIKKMESKVPESTRNRIKSIISPWRYK